MKTLPSINIIALFAISVFIFNTCPAQDAGTISPVLYGTTMGGGKYNNGTMFSYNLATGQESVLIDFDTANGDYPIGNITEDKINGLLYGTTMLGGKDNDGVLFAYNPLTGTDSTLDVFADTNGKWPAQGSLTNIDSSIYGMTNQGGRNGVGVLYKYTPATGKQKVLVNFDTANGKENSPMGAQLATASTNTVLYGMTYAGGKYGMGTIFSFNTVTGKDSVLLSLNQATGTQPLEGTLVYDKNSNVFYGVTSNGGCYNNGVLFSFDPAAGKYSVLVNFNVLNGSNPYGSLVIDSANGLLYGMTYAGGIEGDGVLYSYNTTTNKQCVLVTFNGNTNGSTPTGNVTLGPDGKLYGLTLTDATGNGLLFCYDPSTSKDSVLYTFNYTDGSSPYGSLLFVGNSTGNTVVAGLNTIKQDKNINVYPNPFSVNTNIRVNGESGRHFVEMDDMAGRKLSWNEFNGTTYSLARNGLASGMYIVKLFDSQQQYISAAKVEVN